MEAAIHRIVVFCLARFVQGELFHRSMFAVVGQLINDGEAWTAIRAVDEGIVIAAILRIEEFGHASIAGGKIGRNERGLVRFGIIRKANLEFVEAFDGRFVELKFFHIGRFGRFLHERDRKAIEIVLRTFNVDRYPVERVQHPTRQVELLCAPEDKGPKTDPLNYSFDRNIERFARFVLCHAHYSVTRATTLRNTFERRRNVTDELSGRWM